MRAYAVMAAAAVGVFWGGVAGLRAECPSVNFDNLAVGTEVTTQYPGVTFSGRQGSSAGPNPVVYAPANGTSSGTRCLGAAGEVLKALPPNTAKMKTVRVFQDGDLVFAHTDYNFFGPKIGFDIFRFEDGKIVEHWDNLQEKPKELNPSGHSMTDGPTEAEDVDKTAANKKLVRSFVEEILISGKMEKLAGYFDGDNYLQHHPQIGDGLSGLGKALDAMAKQGITMKYDRIHRVLGEGNFVLVVSEGKFGDKPTSFYDLFRVDNGKIAEHWDTIETILPEEQWKNKNGKF